jgi:transcriptional regulator with XRE-family HTH domain
VRSATRLERAAAVAALESRLAAGQTQRQVAAALGVARSTLQGWRNAAASANPALPASCAAVLETPTGTGWLRRLVCEFLELSGLSAVVPASYCSQQALTAALEAAAVAEEQRAQLAAGMAPRQVAVCEDETFHPAICLVAVEPISNFIVREQYAKDRLAATWTQALRGVLAGLPVAVILYMVGFKN